MSSKSCKELERIVSLLFKYEKNTKLSRNDALIYIVEKMGFKKHNFIPLMFDTVELEELSTLSLRYMRVYSLTLELYIRALLQKCEYCSIVGFQADIEQFKITEG